MNIRSILGLAVVGFVLGACQSNFFQINGFASEWNEGDTVIMIPEMNGELPALATCVSEGKFSFKGEADSCGLYRIFPASAPECSAIVFLEPGLLSVELSRKPGNTRVSGTRINNEWQLLNDSIQLLGNQMLHLMRNTDTGVFSQQELTMAADSLHQKMSECILNTARRNSHNILGKYILENYKAPEFK